MSKNTYKEKIVNYFGGKCLACGFNAYIEAFDVHHLNPSLKDFNLSKPPSKKDWNLIEFELKDCVLLCANCHRGVHAGKVSLPIGYNSTVKNYTLEEEEFDINEEFS